MVSKAVVAEGVVGALLSFEDLQCVLIVDRTPLCGFINSRGVLRSARLNLASIPREWYSVLWSGSVE